MMYEERFLKVHQLLRDHGGKPTFSFERDYQSPPSFGGTFFYRTDKEMDSDHGPKEWEEKVDARLDVCVPVKKSFSERERIRFDIEWSQKAHLYSMYVSLPTSARSVSLSHKRYKTDEELMIDVGNWLVKAGCRKLKHNDFKKPEVKEREQMSLF
jgi:hypothetical protein